MLKGLSTTFGMAVVTLCAKQQVATLTSFAATFTQVIYTYEPESKLISILSRPSPMYIQ